MGFTERTFGFLRDLEAHNTKDWFEENRARYEAEWLLPAQDFVAGIGGVMAGLDPAHQAVPKVNKSIRRINRDVRFSKDKTPYNARLHLVFWTGDHPQKSPAFHLVLSPEYVGFGAGMWGMTPDQLERYRRAVCDPAVAEALQGAVARATDLGCALDAEGLKRVPAGYDCAAGMETYLKRKALVVRMMDGGVSVARFLAGGNGLVRDWAEGLAGVNGWLLRYCC